ncbi:hypothetical protein [Amycolatopsis sp. A1MSW2902]|uniref:hypothetical protein n=1 Tax=Amycolatopsis sp. A1MSW2902 TaxID=687413 RepID=UPI00307F5AD2
MDEDLVARAMRHYAEACTASGHALSGSVDTQCRCGTVAARLEEDRDLRIKAQIFDVQRSRVQAAVNAEEQPDASWTFSALVRLVVDELPDPFQGFDRPFKRIVFLTSALARIAESGVSIDAIVRIGLRHRFKRSAAILASAMLPGISLTGSRNSIPDRTLAWADLLDRCIAESDPGDVVDNVAETESLGDALFERIRKARIGLFADKVAGWLERAPIIDIVSWRYTDLADRSKISEDDLNFPGGQEAVAWLLDRFSLTHYSDWQRTSLYWELRYANNPESTAIEAGVPLSVLRQRPAHVGTVVDAVVTRGSSPLDHENLLGNLTFDQLSSHVLESLKNGRAQQTSELLREITRKYPTLAEARSMFGFALIPVLPDEALDVIGRCLADPENVNVELLRINKASALWRLRRSAEALVVVEGLHVTGFDDDLWLWKPEDLESASESEDFEPGSFNAQEWIAQALKILKGDVAQ